MCYIDECIVEAFFPYYVPDRFLCGFDFNVMNIVTYDKLTTSVVFWLLLLLLVFFIVFCTNYLEQKPSTRKGSLKQILGMMYTHVIAATVGFADHKA